MDIDSACQTKPLWIGSHHVYSKTNFFQVLLPNWNTLLQPSSLFITTPKLIACNTSSKKASQGRKQKTATRRELKALSNPVAQILLYWSCSFFGQYWSLAETCFYFTVLLNMEGSWTNRALLLFNDPVTRKVSPQKETILSTLCMFKLWERKCLCWAAAPLPTNIHSHTHTHTHTHTRDVTFPKLQNAFSDGWLRQALAICVLHIVQFSYEFTVCLSSQEHISRWKKNSYITKSSSHNTPMSGRNSRFIYFYLKILLLNKT